MFRRLPLHATRALRNGRPLADSTDLQRFALLSRRTVVDTLMTEPEFAETVLDFQLYHRGLKLRKTALDDDDSRQYFVDSPGAIRAAFEVDRYNRDVLAGRSPHGNYWA